MTSYATLTPQQILQIMGMTGRPGGMIFDPSSGQMVPLPGSMNATPIPNAQNPYAGTSSPKGFFAQPLPRINPVTGQPMPSGAAIDPRFIVPRTGMEGMMWDPTANNGQGGYVAVPGATGSGATVGVDTNADDAGGGFPDLASRGQ